MREATNTEESREKVASAMNAEMDYLVTNDEKLRLHAPIACLSPADMRALLLT